MSVSPIESSNFQKDTRGIYRCLALEAFDWLEHGFSTRHASEFLTSYPITTLRQVHSAQVWNAHGLTDRCCEGDALISEESGERIGVRTADCVPLLMADPNTRSVAAVHAGWRGSVAKIASRAVEQLKINFGANPADLRVAIGPCIRECCYEVGAEVACQFQEFFPEWLASAQTVSHKRIDLAETNRRILLSTGVSPAHIYDCRLCTSCHPADFFSYRRNREDHGRMISFIKRES